jgi:hypothetical protein
VIVENERYARELERRPTVDLLVIEDSSGLEWWPGIWGLALGTFSFPELSDATSRGVTWGLYGADRIRLRRNLTISLGIRIDREEIRSTGWSYFDPQAERANYLVANLNRIEYRAFVLELIRRQHRNWEMQASYTWSTARGEAEDFARSVGIPDRRDLPLAVRTSVFDPATGTG